MEWKCCEFAHLSGAELYSILRARSAVFVVEYAHLHQDIDDKDAAALHIFALEPESHSAAEQGPVIAAYARLLPGDELDPEVVIDKLLTTAKRRDDDTHDLLVTHTVAAAHTVWPGHPIHINVAAHQEGFYETFGFRKSVGPFLEHGTPYIGMAWSEAEPRPPSGLSRFAAHLGLAPSNAPHFEAAAVTETIDRLKASQ
jgi:ElaA protein